jgi:hypothetical protein
MVQSSYLVNLIAICATLAIRLPYIHDREPFSYGSGPWSGTGAMAVARFQIIIVLGELPPRPTWRFLSANNRRLGRSAVDFADVDTCRFAVREIQDRVGELTFVTLRDGLRRWAWRVRLAGRELAVSTRSYERWVEADHACAAFLEQVAHLPKGQPPQVVQLG